jgi:hypothetical protein
MFKPASTEFRPNMPGLSIRHDAWCAASSESSDDSVEAVIRTLREKIEHDPR